MENFLEFLGSFSIYFQHQRSEEAHDVDRILATPLVKFDIINEKVPDLPDMTKVDKDLALSND